MNDASDDRYCSRSIVTLTPHIALGVVRCSSSPNRCSSSQENSLARQASNQRKILIGPDSSEGQAAHLIFNNVPDVTICFWVFSIPCTTVRETTVDVHAENPILG
jgi:hypothetical protein